MSRGRPALRIGQHGRISRKKLGPGLWLAWCHYRDVDGITRPVERRSPRDATDKYGDKAEALLLAALIERHRAAGGDITRRTLVVDLLDRYVDGLPAANKSPRTVDTYRDAADRLKKHLRGVRIEDAHPSIVDAALQSIASRTPTTARQAKVVLKGAFLLAVRARVLDHNPVAEVGAIRKPPAQGAPAVDADQLRALLTAVQTSEYCQSHDLADPIVLFVATGLRRSELLGARWSDVDLDAGTLSVTGRITRAKGTGLQRIEGAKTDAGVRTIALPRFAVDMLRRRAAEPRWPGTDAIFPSSTGTLRDPNNFGKQWRKVRDELGLPEVTTHSFRKSVATLLDQANLPTRVASDVLGHSKVTITRDTYLARRRVHSAAAVALDSSLNPEFIEDPQAETTSDVGRAGLEPATNGL